MRALLIAVALMFPATASASLTCKQADRAVTRALRQHYGMDSQIDSCQRLSSTRAKVYFTGFTSQDIASGNVDGHPGWASVRRVAYRLDVTVHFRRY